MKLTPICQSLGILLATAALAAAEKPGVKFGVSKPLVQFHLLPHCPRNG